MSKSATEQFQIKKKRKRPFIDSPNYSLATTSSLMYLSSSASALAVTPSTATSVTAITTSASTRKRCNSQQSKVLNLIRNENVTHSMPTGDSESTKHIKLLKTKIGKTTSSVVTLDAQLEQQANQTPLLPSTKTKNIFVKNCLRDQAQVVHLQQQQQQHVNNDTPAVRSYTTETTTTTTTMPLSQTFYVKGAVAAKRNLGATMKPNVSSVSCTATIANPSKHEDAKKPRKNNENHRTVRSLATASTNSKTLLQGQTFNNLHLSYLLGESLARHGRLQEAFDLYALIASEQPEGFIPLEKLQILATALLEYIRILSTSSKFKLSDTDVLSVDDIFQGMGVNTEHAAHTNHKLITPLRSKFTAATSPWQLAVSNLATFATKAPTVNENFLASAVGGNLDLHAPSRELSNQMEVAIGNCDEIDLLLCPLCRDVLRCPVTTNCGHTFCRQCCDTITMCNVCHVKFPRGQKEDFMFESNEMGKLTDSTVTVTCTSTTTSSTGQNLYVSAASAFNVTASLGNTATHSSLTPTSPASLEVQQHVTSFSPRLRIIPSPISNLSPTVTTTSIACTTDTATTTMASTSSTTTSGGVSGRGVTDTVNVNNVGSGAVCGAAAVVITNDFMKFMPDVLVRRLVEKWWGPDLQAKKINETATSYMHLNLLDDALKFCNASLEKSPSNFKSLLLRAEVLRKMNHFQSSLADVENALKCRYTSAKAHYLRALALSDLCRFEEALYEICLAISLDKPLNLTSTELFQHDLTKILQKLLSQTPKCLKTDLSTLRLQGPYNVFHSNYRLRRQKHSANNKSHDFKTNKMDLDEPEEECSILHACDDEEEMDYLSLAYGKECDVLADEDVLTCTDFLNCADKRSVYASISRQYELELTRQTTRKHFRRKWIKKERDLLPPPIDVESARCSSQFRNVLDRLQQEIARIGKIEASPDYAQRQLIQVPASVIDASDFDCILCCRTLWKPVVTPCGHTYCLVCLDRCMDYTSSCPLCMSPLVEPTVHMLHGSTSPVPLMLTKRPQTKFLEAAMKRFIPEAYNKRFRQEMVAEPSVPIFICTTAFPYVPCPLFVYEPRYRLMVRRAVESGEKQFGIVQLNSGKSRYYDYGCILDIRDCVLLGDGCTILSTIGCKRFKILARGEKDGYETAKVEYIHDETIADENISYVCKMHDIVLSKAIQWYDSLGEELKHEILQSYGEMPAVEENWETIQDGPAWAWWIIALLPLRPQLKVDILATTSLEKRLRAIEKTIHSMPGNYRYQEVSENCNVVTVVVHNQQNIAAVEHHIDHDDQIDDDPLQNDDSNEENNANGHESINAELDDEQRELGSDQYHHHHHLQQLHPYDDDSTADECCQRTNASILHHVGTLNQTNDSVTVGASAGAATATTTPSRTAQTLLL